MPWKSQIKVAQFDSSRRRRMKNSNFMLLAWHPSTNIIDHDLQYSTICLITKRFRHGNSYRTTLNLLATKLLVQDVKCQFLASFSKLHNHAKNFIYILLRFVSNACKFVLISQLAILNSTLLISEALLSAEKLLQCLFSCHFQLQRTFKCIVMNVSVYFALKKPHFRHSQNKRKKEIEKNCGQCIWTFSFS
jgi:hypothetical protein